MSQKCSVVNCQSKENVIQYKFPLYNEEVFKIWIMRTANPRLPPLEDLKIYKTYTVCEEHFIDECKIDGGTKLKQFALPTINCPGFYGVPNVENSYPASYLPRIKKTRTLIVKKTNPIDVDHCYTPNPADTPIIQPPLQYINKKIRQVVTQPPLPTLFIDLDKDVFEPQDAPIFLELGNKGDIIKKKINYNYNILNKNLNKSKTLQPVILDLDGENYILAQTKNNDTALEALNLEETPPIYDLTGDDETPTPPLIENTAEITIEAPIITPEVIDTKQIILERIGKKKKLLIKKRLEMENSSKLTLLKPTAISFVPVDGSYKTTVFVHALRNKANYKNLKTISGKRNNLITIA